MKSSIAVVVAVAQAYTRTFSWLSDCLTCDKGSSGLSWESVQECLSHLAGECSVTVSVTTELERAELCDQMGGAIQLPLSVPDKSWQITAAQARYSSTLCLTPYTDKILIVQPNVADDQCAYDETNVYDITKDTVWSYFWDAQTLLIDPFPYSANSLVHDSRLLINVKDNCDDVIITGGTVTSARTYTIQNDGAQRSAAIAGIGLALLSFFTR